MSGTGGIVDNALSMLAGSRRRHGRSPKSVPAAVGSSTLLDGDLDAALASLERDSSNTVNAAHAIERARTLLARRARCTVGGRRNAWRTQRLREALAGFEDLGLAPMGWTEPGPELARNWPPTACPRGLDRNGAPCRRARGDRTLLQLGQHSPNSRSSRRRPSENVLERVGAEARNPFTSRARRADGPADPPRGELARQILG